jgi:dihydrofolate reductase
MLVSLDGYFEGPDHDLSWHNVDAEFHSFVEEQNAQVGMILFGHTTYDRMARFWPTPEALKLAPVTAAFMNETPKVVVSRSPLKPEWSNTTAISSNVLEEIKKLKNQPGKDIAIFGSNQLCVSLMADGLVDEFRILVNPVTLGGGTPLFAGQPQRVKLKLTRTREFRSGNVLNCYSAIPEFPQTR